MFIYVRNYKRPIVINYQIYFKNFLIDIFWLLAIECYRGNMHAYHLRMQTRTEFQFRAMPTMRKFLKLCVDDARFMGFNVSTSGSAQRTVNCLLRGAQVCNITVVGKKNRGFPVGTRPTTLIKETVSSRSRRLNINRPDTST